MRAVFLDTVGLLAIGNVSDQWHAPAEAALGRLGASPCRFVTTPFVLLECGNAAARTEFRADVLSLRNELMAYGNLVSPTADEERTAWEAFARGESGAAGIVDHLSFVVMRRPDILDAFTNDRHFQAAGFKTLF